MAISFQFGSREFDLARKGPDIRHFLDALGVAGNDLAAPIAGGRDQLAHELDGDLGHAVLQLGLDDVGRLDADEALVDLLAATLPIADGAGKAVVDVPAQQAFEGLAVALGKGRDDDLVGRARTLQERIGIEGCIGAYDLHQALGHAGVAGSQALHPLLDIGAHLRLRRRSRLDLLPLAPRQRHDFVLTGNLAVALAGFLLRLVALEPGLLVAGAPPEHTAQLEKDDDRQNQKQ